jgi:hypothetical protein
MTELETDVKANFDEELMTYFCMFLIALQHTFFALRVTNFLAGRNTVWRDQAVKEGEKWTVRSGPGRWCLCKSTTSAQP